MAEMVALVITWSLGPPLPQAKSCRMTALVAGQVVTVGGTWWATTSGSPKPNVKHWTRKVVGYDPAVNKWTRLPDYLRAVGYGAAAVVGDVLYIMGGCNGIEGGVDGKDAIDECYKMDFARKPLVWERAAKLPIKVWASNAAVIRKTIDIVGGRTGSPSYTGNFEIVGDVFAYDTARGDSAVWEKLTPLPSPRAGVAVATVDGKLYVIGGSFDKFGDEKATRFFEDVSMLRSSRESMGKTIATPSSACLAHGHRLQKSICHRAWGLWGNGASLRQPGWQTQAGVLQERVALRRGNRLVLPGTPMPHGVLDCGAVCDGKTIYVCGGEDAPNRTRVNWLQIGPIIMDPTKMPAATVSRASNPPEEEKAE